VWQATNAKTVHRSYLYYSTDTTTNQQWYQPRIDLCDGTEPTIAELIAGVGSKWYDLTGTNHGNILNSAALYNSAGYMTFDGVDDSVSIIKPNPNITGTISLNFWIYFNSTAAVNPIHKGSHYTLLMTNSSWNWADSSNYSYASFVSRTVSNLYSTGQWYNFVVTKNNSFDVSLYRNGVLLDTRTAFGGSLTSVNSTLWLSGYSDTDTPPTTQLLNGRLAAVKIYNKALSAAEIQQNFNALRGRFGI
jgi:hypothetical protein